MIANIQNPSMNSVSIDSAKVFGNGEVGGEVFRNHAIIAVNQVDRQIFNGSASALKGKIAHQADDQKYLQEERNYDRPLQGEFRKQTVLPRENWGDRSRWSGVWTQGQNGVIELTALERVKLTSALGVPPPLSLKHFVHSCSILVRELAIASGNL